MNYRTNVNNILTLSSVKYTNYLQVPDYQGEKFKLFLERQGISKVKAAEMLGISRQGLYQYFTTSNLERETVKKILLTFGKTSEDIFGEPESNTESISKFGEPEESLYNVTKRSARDLGELNYPYEYVGENKDNTYINIGNGQYLMLMPLVDEFAYGSYPGGFKDREYIEDLQKHTIVVDKKHHGCYRAFEMIGNSMENYESEEMAKQSIPDGSIVTGRNIQRHHWTSRLHINKWDFIVVHKEDGITVKRIKEHNIVTGNIILTSLNPDKIKHKDFIWNLDDIAEIYSVVNVSQERR